MNMIEKIVLDYLNETLAAYTQEPTNKNPGGSNFVVVEKTGGTITNHIKDSVIAAQSYAPSLYEASLLNEEVKELMLALPDQTAEVSGIRLIGDSNFTDPDTRQPRYQSVFEIYHY